MPLRNTPETYGTVARALHWIIVVLVILQFVSISIADDLPNGLEKLKVMANHKSFGMLILMLAIVRLAWRLGNPVPPPPAASPGWQRRLASTSHVLLYALLFAQPVTGWITSTTRNFPVSFFNLFQFPDLVGPDDRLHGIFEDIHGTLAVSLLVLAVLHAGAALHHHFWRKDDVLRRMLPFGKPGSAP